MPHQDERRTIIVQTAFLGDLLLSIPLMKHARRLWPTERLSLLARRGLGNFFVETGLVDDVIEIQKGDRASYRTAASSARGVTRIISPHGSLRTAFWIRGLGAGERVGFQSPWTRWAYTRTVRRRIDLPDALRQLQLIAGFDDQIESSLAEYQTTSALEVDGRVRPVPTWASMSLASLYDSWLGRREELRQKLDLESQRPVLIFPGSVWATKRWGAKSYGELARLLIAEGRSVIVMGGPGEEAIAEEVAAMAPGSRNLAGKTSLIESALLLRWACVMVGNDSASVHLAATAETPTVAIFGPTIPEFGFRPWQDRAWIVQQQGLACRPCGPHGHHVCPRRTHECMTGISVASVHRLVKKVASGES